MKEAMCPCSQGRAETKAPECSARGRFFKLSPRAKTARIAAVDVGPVRSAQLGSIPMFPALLCRL